MFVFHRNIRHACVTIVKEEGGLFSGCLFRGLGPSLIVRVTYDNRKELALIHDCIYIACKSMLKKTVLHCIYYYIFVYSLQPYFLHSKGDSTLHRTKFCSLWELKRYMYGITWVTLDYTPLMPDGLSVPAAVLTE